MLPVGSLFSPLIADMKEPQFSLAYRHVRFRDKGLPAGREDSEISAGLVALGGGPIFGADFNSLEERDWDVTTSLKGGMEWGVVDTTRRVRLLFVYLNGFVPFGQFFNTEKIESFGIELEFLL